jgi:hypothetical protein|tara:strand:+ start:288 stop:479 length:192 start_codon:yes stop_codon:yes gene_type:complete
MKFKTEDKKPNEEELVLVYLNSFNEKPTVGKWSGRSWAILHEINNQEPISFGECVPFGWKEII